MASGALAPALHGWLILDKPIGPGSTSMVGAVKRVLREGGYAKVKVGHGGTLDPLASGILPIALGEATKLAGRMLDSDKHYDFTIAFGSETDTLDKEGRVVRTSPVRPEAGAVAAVIEHFTGPIDQVPPAFSALKIDGERAYDLARAGETVVLKTRAVIVHRLTLVSTDDASATFAAHVSKGTYIRSLARDIALALGTVGHVSMLRRTRAGPFSLKSAISLDKLQESAKARRLQEALLPLTAGLDDIPALPVTLDQARLLRQGQTLTGIAAQHGLCFAMTGTTPVALVEVSDGNVRVLRGFNL